MVIMGISACAVFLVFFLVLERGESYTLSRRCNYTIKAKDSARNEFQETKTTVIVPKCSTNGITWNKPHYPHIITFFKSFRSFVLCLKTLTPGVTIHRLKGKSRQLVASSNNTGHIECLESQCKHVTLLMEPDEGAEFHRAYYTYTYSEEKKCPKCSELCQQQCLCGSEYVLIGTLQRSEYDRSKIYTHYIRLAEYVKYNNSYNEHAEDFLLPHANQLQCTVNNITTYISTYNTVPRTSNSVHRNTHRFHNSVHLQDIRMRPPGFLPYDGTIKIYSKYPLDVGQIYLISGHVGLLTVAGRMQERFILCCAEEDESHAASQLEGLLYRNECCRYHN